MWSVHSRPRLSTPPRSYNSWDLFFRGFKIPATPPTLLTPLFRSSRFNDLWLNLTLFHRSSKGKKEGVPKGPTPSRDFSWTGFRSPFLSIPLSLAPSLTFIHFWYWPVLRDSGTNVERSLWRYVTERRSDHNLPSKEPLRTVHLGSINGYQTGPFRVYPKTGPQSEELKWELQNPGLFIFIRSDSIWDYPV